MEADADCLIGAGRHERNGEGAPGATAIARDTCPGTLNLYVPKLRQGSHFPDFRKARKTSEQAPVAVIREAWIGGVSTWHVGEPVPAMG